MESSSGSKLTRPRRTFRLLFYRQGSLRLNKKHARNTRRASAGSRRENHHPPGWKRPRSQHGDGATLKKTALRPPTARGRRGGRDGRRPRRKRPATEHQRRAARRPRSPPLPAARRGCCAGSAPRGRGGARHARGAAPDPPRDGGRTHGARGRGAGIGRSLGDGAQRGRGGTGGAGSALSRAATGRRSSPWSSRRRFF